MKNAIEDVEKIQGRVQGLETLIHPAVREHFKDEGVIFDAIQGVCDTLREELDWLHEYMEKTIAEEEEDRE